MEMLHKNTEVRKSEIIFLPMIDLNPSDPNCVLSTLEFIVNQARAHSVTPVVTFDQPLWLKAVQLIDAENPGSPLKDMVVRLGGFHTLMSFFGCMGHLMACTGLEDLMETIYARNTIPHILSGKSQLCFKRMDQCAKRRNLPSLQHCGQKI
jgi:hypothetical protein